MPRTNSWRLAAVAIVAGCLVVAGCTKSSNLTDDEPADPATTTSSPSSPSSSPSGSGLASFYDQKLDWQGCGDYKCATATVPVDYADPSGATLKLALRMKPAKDQGDKLGAMFINPGGPGGSGIDYVQYFTSDVSSKITDRYDVIGFDPRGVGKSTPLRCLDDADLDTFINTDPDPDTTAEEQQYAAEAKKMGTACRTNSGALAAHVSTIEVAKDLDVLRGAYGDKKITYAGASYGTAIGATYAQLFPKNVGRMVLDGALDPSLSSKQANLGQAKGFQTALAAYVKDCIQKASCPLGRTESGAMTKLKGFLGQLDSQPLRSGDPKRPVTEALGFYGIAVTLYNKDYWPYLTAELQSAFKGDGRQMLNLADQYLSRTSSGYADNSAQVIYAVNCLDTPDTTTLAQAKASEGEYLKVSPVFGRTFAWGPVGCSAWPIKPTLKPLTIKAAGAAPIVVVGTTRDPATPYQWAVSLSKELESGVLISRDGDGHTGYNMGNSCVDDAVNGYLLGGKVPSDGLKC